MRMWKTVAARSLVLLILVSVGSTCHAGPSDQAKVLREGLLTAYAQWKSLTGRLMDRWDDSGGGTIVERYNKVMTGSPGGETVLVTFSYAGGSSASLNFKILNPAYGVVFDKESGDWGDVLLVDVDPKHKGVEVVTTRYLTCDYYTEKESAAISRMAKLSRAQQELGVPVDWSGPRPAVESRREAHLTPHRYIIDVWEWDATTHRYSIRGSFGTNRLYDPMLSHRQMLIELAAAGLAALDWGE